MASNLTTYTNYVSSVVTYTNGERYQKSGGAFTDIFQLDFTINADMTAGTDYYFFLTAPPVGSYGTVGPFLHASNAGLSGSNQEGADGLTQWLNTTSNAIASFDTNYPGVWDKSSDANIQIYGNPVPEPATMTLFGIGLLGLAGITRKKK